MEILDKIFYKGMVITKCKNGRNIVFEVDGDTFTHLLYAREHIDQLLIKKEQARRQQIDEWLKQKTPKKEEEPEPYSGPSM